MDPQTLPEKELALYKAIKSELKVAFEPLKIKDTRLNLLKCTDIEQLLDGKDPLKNSADFPLWNTVWDATVMLAHFFAAQSPKSGTTLLELGSGLGVTGLAAAAAGYEVTMTDYEQRILDFLQINAAASNIEDVTITHYDWFNPTDIGQFDIIAGAEILYRKEFFEPLHATFTSALKPGGSILLAHDASRQNIAPFFERIQKDFSISVTKRKLKSLEKDTMILLARLQPKELNNE
ncbi:MAG: methyltransferase [Desulfobulbus propionicus]|nr:MAG: methyltransferase [Desulfobulbus propionicus]